MLLAPVENGALPKGMKLDSNQPKSKGQTLVQVRVLVTICLVVAFGARIITSEMTARSLHWKDCLLTPLLIIAEKISDFMQMRTSLWCDEPRLY